MKVIRHHAVGQELHARKPRDASDEVHQPRTLLVVKKERTMGDTTDQVVHRLGRLTRQLLMLDLLWQFTVAIKSDPHMITYVLSDFRHSHERSSDHSPLLALLL